MSKNRPSWHNFAYSFIQLESLGGIVLLLATISALVLANTGLNYFYQNFFLHTYTFRITQTAINFSILDFINHGLMAIFFLLVSLEIKRELIDGELASVKKSALPIIAAAGGMLVPAIIFLLINLNHPQYHAGWAIPVATDIAFSLGVLALLGNKIPQSLKVFLTTLAIVDDIGAIMIIALFYSNHIFFIYLLLALTTILILCLLNYLQINLLWPYLLFGLLLWIFITKSGIHSTVAGVILAFTIPHQNNLTNNFSLLKILENKIHPWVAFGIIPLFALGNAGLRFDDINLQLATSPLVLGIFFGLILGKQWGVFASTWISKKLNLVDLPSQTNWQDIYGVSALCGIGFTMSLFIGSLAFPNIYSPEISMIKLGVISASTVSGIMGYLILYFSQKNKN